MDKIKKPANPKIYGLLTLSGCSVVRVAGLVTASANALL
jgi:hypothetical protein